MQGYAVRASGEESWQREETNRSSWVEGLGKGKRFKGRQLDTGSTTITYHKDFFPTLNCRQRNEPTPSRQEPGFDMQLPAF